jgi:Domain of unknown function (DUF2935)
LNSPSRAWRHRSRHPRKAYCSGMPLEVDEFWTRIMFDHARFIAHLLDPDEEALIAQASDIAGTFRELHETPPPSDGDPVLEAANEIVDFKTAAEQGFVDDLKRAP